MKQNVLMRAVLTRPLRVRAKDSCDNFALGSRNEKVSAAKAPSAGDFAGYGSSLDQSSLNNPAVVRYS